MLICLEPFLCTYQHWSLYSHTDSEIFHSAEAERREHPDHRVWNGGPQSP